MTSKYLLFPFFWLIVPFIIYFSGHVISGFFIIDIKPFGYIDEHILGNASILGNIKKIYNEPESVVFVGDVMLARNVEFLMKTKGVGYPFLTLPTLFGLNKAVIGNFEASIPTKHIPTPSFVTRFSVDKKYIPLLPTAGFTHLSLANNHSLDHGEAGYLSTKQVLENVGINVFGHPQNILNATTSVIQLLDTKIGLLALNDIGAKMTMETIIPVLDDLSLTTDYQIVYIHWGEEYILKHNQTQENRAKALIDAGADAVIGHHPHVTQDIQVYNNKPIFYSLGNFIFDQYFSVDVSQGLLLKLSFTDKTANYEIHPVTSEGTRSQPHKMAETEKRVFLENLARRSSVDYQDYIKTGLLTLPL